MLHGTIIARTMRDPGGRRRAVAVLGGAVKAGVVVPMGLVLGGTTVRRANSAKT